MKYSYASRTFKAYTFASRTLAGGIPLPSGPFRAAATQAWVAGATQGQGYTAGSRAANSYVAGAQEAQAHG